MSKRDRLILVGDVVVRGPDPHGVVSLLRSLDASAVRGNHEDRLLRWRRAKRTDKPLKIGPVTQRTAQALKPKDWDYLESLPMWLDLREHGVRVVHAGLVPSVPMHEQDPRALLYMRSFGPGGRPTEERGIQSWAQGYAGAEHVVFGHNAQDEPEIAEHATGLDTGAVYGGRLTAMVLREGQRPPPALLRRDVLVSVPARRMYVVRHAGSEPNNRTRRRRGEADTQHKSR
jgi:hypothetical protein